MHLYRKNIKSYSINKVSLCAFYMLILSKKGARNKVKTYWRNFDHYWFPAGHVASFKLLKQIAFIACYDYISLTNFIFTKV